MPTFPIEDIQRIRKQYDCDLITAKDIYKAELAEKRLQTIESDIAAITENLAATANVLENMTVTLANLVKAQQC